MPQLSGRDRNFVKYLLQEASRDPETESPKAVAGRLQQIESQVQELLRITRSLQERVDIHSAQIGKRS